MTADTHSPVVPKLRFPDFRSGGEWIIKLLETQGSFLPPLTGKAAKDFDRGDAVFIPYMNVFSNTFTNTVDLRSVEVASSESQNAVAKGDVLFTVSSETPEEAGMSSVLLEEIENCYLNSFCALFRFDEGKTPNPVFLGYLLRSATAREHLSRGAQGATRYNISRATFRSLPIQLPSSPEQDKIADCLLSLDDLISAEDRKLETLRQHKQGLVQQLFPGIDESQPKLRLPRYSGAAPWKPRRISELIQKESVPIAVLPGRKYREIGVRSHGRGVFHKEPGLGSEIGDKRVFQVAENALVLNIVFAWEGAVAVTSQNEVGMIGSHRFPMYVPRKSRSDTRFMKSALLTQRGANLLSVASPGGAGRNRTLGQGAFANLRMIVPEKDEQRDIADLMGGIDSHVEAQAKKCVSLAQHKRGLLQQLFPSPEER